MSSLLRLKRRCTLFSVIVTAIDGQDYDAISAFLVFPVGVANGSMQCLNVTVYNDEIIEYDEVFLVELTVLSPGVIEGNAVTFVTIMTQGEDGECIHIFHGPQ